MKINALLMIIPLLCASACMQNNFKDQQNETISQTLWYQVDLSDPQNKNLFTREIEPSNGEIKGDLAYNILTGVLAGILRPFKNDDLKERMMYEEFAQNLDTAKLFRTQAYRTLLLKKVLRFSPAENQMLNNSFFSKNLWKQIESHNDTSKKLNYEIEAISVLKEDGSILATFSFEEIATNVLIDNTTCDYWVNKSKQQKMNMFDALNHGLYFGKITQYKDNEGNKIIKINKENDLLPLQSKYAPYPTLQAKIVFSHIFDEATAGKVFDKYQAK